MTRFIVICTFFLVPFLCQVGSHVGVGEFTELFHTKPDDISL